MFPLLECTCGIVYCAFCKQHAPNRMVHQCPIKRAADAIRFSCAVCDVLAGGESDCEALTRLRGIAPAARYLQALEVLDTREYEADKRRKQTEAARAARVQKAKETAKLAAIRRSEKVLSEVELPDFNADGCFGKYREAWPPECKVHLPRDISFYEQW